MTIKIGGVEIGDALLNNDCVVKFNGRAYPGRIVNVSEDDIEINCMSHAGHYTVFLANIRGKSMV